MKIQPTVFICAVLALLNWRAATFQGIPKIQQFRSMSGLLPNGLELARLSDPGILIATVDLFIFDCEGVIWTGDALLKGVSDTLERIRSVGKRCFFFTNNSSKSRLGYKKKFDELGLDVLPEEILSSSYAVAVYLEKKKFKDTGKSVYVIGERGIEEELALIGIPFIGGEAGKDLVLTHGDHDKNVGAVIVGFDRYINKFKIQYAQQCINKNTGCLFIATSWDAITLFNDVQKWTENQSDINCCKETEPIIVGKPAPLMIEYICDKLGVKKERICMVGDRLESDILFGKNNGIKTCLVLSGVTSEKTLLSAKNKIIPDYYCDSICDFFPDDFALKP